MRKLNLSKITAKVCMAAKKHSPEILTGIGIAGMITTVVMAVKVTPKAITLLDDEIKYRLKSNNVDGEENIEGLIKVSDDENGEYGHYKLPAKDIFKTAWKCYIPSAVICGASMFCIIGASSVNLRRNAALATAYTLSESALKEYQEKVIETIGEKKERSVRDAIAKDKIDKNPVSNREVIITGKGEALCYDAITGRYFKSNIDIIKKAVNELNQRMINEMFIPLNDFYYEIGLNNTKIGDDLGWHIDCGLIDLDYGSQLTDDGTPCLVIDYRVAPMYDYAKYNK